MDFFCFLHIALCVPHFAIFSFFRYLFSKCFYILHFVYDSIFAYFYHFCIFITDFLCLFLAYCTHFSVAKFDLTLLSFYAIVYKNQIYRSREDFAYD